MSVALCAKNEHTPLSQSCPQAWMTPHRLLRYSSRLSAGEKSTQASHSSSLQALQANEHRHKFFCRNTRKLCGWSRWPPSRIYARKEGEERDRAHARSLHEKHLSKQTTKVRQRRRGRRRKGRKERKERNHASSRVTPFLLSKILQPHRSLPRRRHPRGDALQPLRPLRLSRGLATQRQL